MAGFDIRTQPEADQGQRRLHFSQKFSLYQDLTVEENIDFYAGIYRIGAKEKAQRKLWVLEMSRPGIVSPSADFILSGGWKQRLALGFAILHRPPILFLDEPTSGVDPISRRQFWDLIYEMSSEGVTIFVSTHYMDEAEYCDRLALIYRGELIAQGTPATLKHEAMQEDVLELFCERPEAAMDALSGLASVKEVGACSAIACTWYQMMAIRAARKPARGWPSKAFKSDRSRRSSRRWRTFLCRSSRPAPSTAGGGATMNARRVTAVARKELLHIVRDPRSLGMAIAIPMLMLLLFGFALTLDVHHVPLVVWDQNGTPDSRELVSQFAKSPYFLLVRYVDSERAMNHAIDSDEALMGLIIPYDFAQRLSSATKVPLEVVVSGVDSNTATIALGYADAIANIYSQEWLIRRFGRKGPTKVPIPLDVRARVWFNADLESKNYIVPGLIAVIMMVIAAMLTSLCFAREWEARNDGAAHFHAGARFRAGLRQVDSLFAIGLLDMVWRWS